MPALYPAWTAGVASVIGLAFALCGAVVAMVSVRRLHRTRGSLGSTQVLLDLQQLQERGADVVVALSRLPDLRMRANAAVVSMGRSARTLRLPQAVAALQGAVAAVRLLARSLGASG